MTGSESGILSHIGELVDEERRLRGRHQGSPLDDDELVRLEQIEVELDQCWDLLQQRRALREFGMDLERAEVRDAGTVERYQQ